MTLSTYFVIGAVESPSATAEAVYQFCRTGLNTPDDVEPKREQDKCGYSEIWHPAGIGLSAWLLMKYRPGGPSMAECPRYDHEDDEEYAQSVEWHNGQPMNNGFGCIQVNWDTAYSYRGPQGESCSELHAALIAALGVWCDKRGIAWKWKNEFTGEWFDGMDGLQEFAGDYANGPSQWFNNVAMPAILAEINGAP